MGFLVLDQLAEVLSADFDREKFNGVYALVKNSSLEEPVILAKPMTFMNNSGEFVRPLMEYFKIPLEDLVVVYDDMAIEEGKIRLRASGSAGGHNGIRSIIANLGSEDFKRIRVGIGEPVHSGIDWVLTRPENESLEKIQSALDKATKACRDYLLHGFTYSMNHYNG